MSKYARKLLAITLKQFRERKIREEVKKILGTPPNPPSQPWTPAPPGLRKLAPVWDSALQEYMLAKQKMVQTSWLINTTTSSTNPPMPGSYTVY